MFPVHVQSVGAKLAMEKWPRVQSQVEGCLFCRYQVHGCLDKNSFRQIARNLNIAHSTAALTFTRFEETGNVDPSNQPQRERCLDDHHELCSGIGHGVPFILLS